MGPAGVGKSTLAMACARRGFGVLAEDAIFVRVRPVGREWWGMPWVQRLLPDARALFPELAALPDRPRPNGESKIDVELDDVQPGLAVPCAAAGPTVVLVRDDGGPTRIEVTEAASSRSTGRGTAAGPTRTNRRRAHGRPARTGSTSMVRPMRPSTSESSSREGSARVTGATQLPWSMRGDAGRPCRTRWMPVRELATGWSHRTGATARRGAWSAATGRPSVGRSRSTGWRRTLHGACRRRGWLIRPGR